MLQCVVSPTTQNSLPNSRRLVVRRGFFIFAGEQDIVIERAFGYISIMKRQIDECVYELYGLTEEERLWKENPRSYTSLQKQKTIPVPAKAGFHRKHSTRENIYPFIDANAIKTRLFKK
ncbi:MAG: hypothetical protein ABSD46_06455 [Bacteroidota bacterium]